MPLTRAEKPFTFKTHLVLVMMTGRKASNLAELRNHLREVPESSVYQHTHHFVRQHQFLTPEPPNDFAYWVSEVLREEAVGERLASIDTVRFTSLAELRNAIVKVLDDHLATKPPLREAPAAERFYFLKTKSFSLPTPHTVYDLAEFVDALKKISINSIYYHVFEGLLRPPVGINDFSHWLADGLGEKELADRIKKFDPYTQTMDSLRNRMVALIETRLKKEAAHATA